MWSGEEDNVGILDVIESGTMAGFTRSKLIAEQPIQFLGIQEQFVILLPLFDCDTANLIFNSHEATQFPTMHYSDELEMWDLEELLDKSPLSTLTADLEAFKHRYSKLLDGDFSLFYHEEETIPQTVSQCTQSKNNSMQSSGSSTYRTTSSPASNKSAKRPSQLPVTPIVSSSHHSPSYDMRLKYGFSQQDDVSARPKTARNDQHQLSRSRNYDQNSLTKARRSNNDKLLKSEKKDHWCRDESLEKQYTQYKAYLECDNKYVAEDSRAIQSPDLDVNSIGATHRGTHRFIPRHDDEVAIEIGDSLHVLHEADDLWCMGVNLRTGKQGIFPSVYATDLNFYKIKEDEPIINKQRRTFQLHFLGSIEVSDHRGSDILVDAIQKIIVNRRLSKDSTPPPLCQLDISEAGIKMIDLTHQKRTRKVAADLSMESVSNRLSKLLAFNKESKAVSNHFFSLKNISFCGYHPDYPRYFGFITKHPAQRRFACHCFSSVTGNTQQIVDAVGEAFHLFYCGYMAFNQYTEDIYIE